jgi:hypothetical protein
MKNAQAVRRSLLLLTGICVLYSSPSFLQANSQTVLATDDLIGDSQHSNVDTRWIVNQSSTHVDTQDPNVNFHGTVVVGIALSEGIVLAGDSRLTQTGMIPGQSRVLSDNGSKVFNVGKFGIATYGEAFLKKRTISSWIEDFRKEYNASEDIDSFGDHFAKFFGEVYNQSFPNTSQRPTLGFLIAGYDSKGKGKLNWMEFPNQVSPKPSHDTQDNTGAQWNGQTDVIQRLILGYDPTLGVLPAFNSISQDQRSAMGQQLPSLQYNIAWNGLMLQDGIDLASTFIKTTINIQRFANGTLLVPIGVPGVGGTIDVLVVKPAGVDWIRHKALTFD